MKKPQLQNYVFIGDYFNDLRAYESEKRAEKAKLFGMIGFAVIFAAVIGIGL